MLLQSGLSLLFFAHIFKMPLPKNESLCLNKNGKICFCLWQMCKQTWIYQSLTVNKLSVHRPVHSLFSHRLFQPEKGKNSALRNSGKGWIGPLHGDVRVIQHVILSLFCSLHLLTYSLLWEKKCIFKKETSQNSSSMPDKLFLASKPRSYDKTTAGNTCPRRLKQSLTDILPQEFGSRWR